MLYAKAINAIVRKAGTATEMSFQSMSATPPIISTPTYISAAAVAHPGIRAAIGLKNMAIKKRQPVVNAERPVLPPSATPDDDSTKVVTVDVPHIAPTQVAMASDNIAFSKLGTCPSLSSKSPLEHAPYKVPRVSNISTMQKASAVVAMTRTRSALVWSAR